jgi:hypothetical protein
VIAPGGGRGGLPECGGESLRIRQQSGESVPYGVGSIDMKARRGCEAVGSLLTETVMLTKKQILDSFEHNIAQFHMQIEQETDPAKRAALEELVSREQTKHREMSRSSRN